MIRISHHKNSLKYIRCDNVGENKSLQKDINQIDIPIIFEYTPRDTPKNNVIMERNFQNIFMKMREIMNGEGKYGHLRKKLWEECSQTCTFIQNIIVGHNDEKSPYKHFLMKKSKIITD